MLHFLYIQCEFIIYHEILVKMKYLHHKMASNARKPLLKAFLSICLKLLVVPKITKPFLLATLAALHFSSFRFPDTSYFICVKGVSLLCQDFFFFFFWKELKSYQIVCYSSPSPQTVAIPIAALP